MTVPLQTATPVAVAGTVGSLALFLALTAHIAARNVLGDVPVQNALGVGILPAVFASLPQAIGLNPSVAIAGAVLVDGAAIKLLYGRDWKLSAYITLIHAVVSVILGTVVVSLALLLLSAPGGG
ncbi:MAG: hypothetical protein ABEJ74_03030 [Haloferacaceae archaeon]